MWAAVTLTLTLALSRRWRGDSLYGGLIGESQIMAPNRLA